MDKFTVEKTSGEARAGFLPTQRGIIKTPVFMPPATRGAIKGGVSFDDLESTGIQICLGNTYHLYLRPGPELVAQFGGLHDFMKWQKPILTDSGGFQVFSIKSKKITDEGVSFRSHINGDLFYLDAETSIDIQHKLGSDILMIFDECPPNKPNWHKIAKAVDRTAAWAKRSKEAFSERVDMTKPVSRRPQLFGIVQGGSFEDLRSRSLQTMIDLDFDGIALGGLAVGETNEEMYKVVGEHAPQLPANKPRYLMGVGMPRDLLECIERGIDMFDCVLPMRNARHGLAYTYSGVKRIKNAEYRTKDEVLEPSLKDYVSVEKRFSCAYLHHLMRVDEDLGKRLLTMHNLAFYQDLMAQARKHIVLGDFSKWKKEVLSAME
ncbi:MAG TPA: tRNA guanosine(34) transglycosylase Tgt [Candidatus Gracilibacteria bacterium]